MICDVEIIRTKNSLFEENLRLINEVIKYLKFLLQNEDLKLLPGDIIDDLQIKCKNKIINEIELEKIVDNNLLSTEIFSIIINSKVNLNNVNNLKYKVYRLDYVGPQSDFLDDCSGESSSTPVFTISKLPSFNLHGLWESLIYENDVKLTLLDYAQTSWLFGERNINPLIIPTNRMILLHGPPGTGKTSLCRGFAQKLSIRLINNYPNSVLIEINSHTLFSKWFSESGKLVTKMFTRIKEICVDENNFVFILLDEVESLVHARNKIGLGTEPSDAIRVVNAMLTQLDQISHYKNCIILTTSNITKTIDLAFVDRADIKWLIDYPSIKAIYQILINCLEELNKKEILWMNGTLLLQLKHLRDEDSKNSFDPDKIPEQQKVLLSICEKCHRLSGRTLRKIPFLTFAKLHGKLSDIPIDINLFLAEMKTTVDSVQKDLINFNILN